MRIGLGFPTASPGQSTLLALPQNHAVPPGIQSGHNPIPRARVSLQKVLQMRQPAGSELVTRVSLERAEETKREVTPVRGRPWTVVVL